MMGSFFAPSTWEDISTVALLIVLAMVFGFALKQGWIVLGYTHREIVRMQGEIVKSSDEERVHLRGRSLEDQQIISTLTTTVSEQRVSGELSAHVIQAIREATGRATSS